MANYGAMRADPCAYRPGTDHDWRPAELAIGQQSFLLNPSSHEDAMWVSFDDIERIDETDRSNDMAELDVVLADQRILGLRVNPELLGRMLSSLEEATAGEAAAPTTSAEVDDAPEGSAAAAPGMPPPLPPMGAVPPMRPTHQLGPTPPAPSLPETPAEQGFGPGAGADVDSPVPPANPRPATISPDLTTTDPTRTDADAPGHFTISPRDEPRPEPSPIPVGEVHSDEPRRRRPLALFGLAVLVLLGAVLLVQLLGGNGDDTASTEDSVAPTTTQPPTTAAPDLTQPTATTPEQTPNELSVTVIEVQAAEQDGDRAIYADLELRNDTEEDVSNFQVVIDIALVRDGDSVVASFAMTCDSPLPAGAQRSGTYTGDVDADADSFADCTVAGWTVDPQDATQLAVAEAIAAGATADATARVLSVTGADGSGSGS